MPVNRRRCTEKEKKGDGDLLSQLMLSHICMSWLSFSVHSLFSFLFSFHGPHRCIRIRTILWAHEMNRKRRRESETQKNSCGRQVKDVVLAAAFFVSVDSSCSARSHGVAVPRWTKSSPLDPHYVRGRVDQRCEWHTNCWPGKDKEM